MALAWPFVAGSYAQGHWVAVMMADASDDPEDLVRFFRKAQESDDDAVFGNRFTQAGRVVDYPLPKLLLNRLTNWPICLLFATRYTDVTNAFKLYRKTTLEGLKPYLSPHFNFTVELPLKVIVRGVQLCGPAQLLAQSQGGRIQAEAQGDGKPLLVHHSLLPH